MMRFRILLLVPALLFAVAVFAFAFGPGGIPTAAAQSNDDIIQFSLTAHDGRRVSEQDFAGRYMLIQFGYTWCPDVCPMELALLAEVLDGLGAEAENVRPLFVTFDPARDNAAVLAEYETNFHPMIIGLTGSEQEIANIVHAFGVVLFKEEEDDGDYTFAHSANTYLLGPKSDYRGSIKSLAPPDKVAAGLVKFLREETSQAE